MSRQEKKCTNQFVVLSGELGEPLVKLQDCYYSHQIPEEEKTGRKEKVIAATRFFFFSITFQHHLRLMVTSAHFDIKNKSCHTYSSSLIFQLCGPLIPTNLFSHMASSVCNCFHNYSHHVAGLYFTLVNSNTHLFSRWLKSCRLSSLVSCVK